MWFLWAVLGALLAGQIWSGLWIIGALLGGILGWSLGSRARQAENERFRLIDERLQRVEAMLDRLDQRPAAPDVSGRPAAVPEQSVRSPAREPARAAAVAAAQPSAAVSAAASVGDQPAAAAVGLAESVAAGQGPRPPSPTPAPIGVPPPVPPPASRPPFRGQEPALRESRPSPVRDWLLRGNVMARAGVVILFFGVAFLLKYTYQHVHVPLELRLAGVALAAVALLLIGWRLRLSREGYALALQGGGVGLLYLTIFGALRLFGLLPAGPAFALLLAVAALSALLAVLQNSLALAVLGASGGFLAPILASTGEGSHVALFGYYAVLNAGILAIAWFRAWRLLNLVGFAFTFGIATVWGVLSYRPDLYASTEPFLVLFFLMYVAIPVLFSRPDAGLVERHLDTTLIFGVPLIAFALQVALVREFAYGSAWSALALGAFYLLLARTLWSRRGEGQRLLVEAFLALGVVFTTLAIPLAFDGRWTSAAWAIEGAAMLWVGVRQKRLPPRLFGILLQFLAGAFYLHDLRTATGEWPLLNSACLGALLLALAGLFCAWLLQRQRQDLHRAEHWLAPLLFAWGVAWWAAGGLREIDRHVRYALQGNAALAFFTASCLAFSALERRLHWPQARYPALALLPLMILLALASSFQDAHPFAHLGYLAWPLAFAAHFYLLYRHEAPGQRHLAWLHAAGLWLLAALGAWQVAWAIDHWVAGRAAWPLIAWALVPGALLALLALRGERIRWPVAAHLATYLVSGAVPLAAFLAAWFVFGNVVSDGNPWPLPYLPVLNPLDLAQAGALLAVGTWFVEVRRRRLPPVAALSLPVAWSVAGAAAFLWANAVLLRTLHHWAGVPLDPGPLLRSDLVQASLSLFWTLLALAAMVVATRRAWRPLWLTGAGLMAVVVGKLLLVDLSNAGTIERIVSFLGVGVLMLVIGYLAPVPPIREGPAE
ncbi:MAG: DUF2339 domain-containing protein [Candidatus Accumulibacter sp.]|uniref:DUF2339 domain-containing protein n=1 Tax=Candidatus Accumulibacter proximus TaxID=2954385 RepID=A0A935Q3L2_9PROT|nr:DUF2339 domain-containing protein [Candidatus Accumulibacter proximus]